MRKVLMGLLLCTTLLLTACESHQVVCSSDGGVYDQTIEFLGHGRTLQMDGQTCTINKDGSFTVMYVDDSNDGDSN